ncbi:MAG: MlaD family protein [Elusimicrobiota bacterium]|nr:MlaD family protein [Elusimicrobiota bacterium]
MHFKFKHRQKLVGGFFLLSCVIVIILLVIVARGQKWLQAYNQYVTYLEEGKGLRVGTGVTIKGLDAGHVYSVDLGPDNRVKVGIRVFRHYAGRINSGASISLVQPLIGSNSLEIIPGPDSAVPLAKDDVIPSVDEGKTDFKPLIDTTTRLIRDLQDPRGNLMQTLASLNATTKNLQNPQGDLMQALTNLNTATRKLSDALDSEQGTVGLLMQKRELYDKLSSASAHLDAVLAGMENSTPELKASISAARTDLEESEKVIRSLQKNFFIRGNIENRMKEDAALGSEGRTP